MLKMVTCNNDQNFSRRISSSSFFCFLFYFIYLFIWLRQVLVVELRIFVEVWGLFVVVLGLLSSCGMWVFSL